MVNKRKQKISREKRERRRKIRKREEGKRKLQRKVPALWSEEWFADRAFLYVDDPRDKSELKGKVDFIFRAHRCKDYILVEHKNRIFSKISKNWLEDIMNTASNQFFSIRQELNLLDSPKDSPSALIIRYTKLDTSVLQLISNTLSSEASHCQIDTVCVLFTQEKLWRKRAVCVYREGHFQGLTTSDDFLTDLFRWTEDVSGIPRLAFSRHPHLPIMFVTIQP